MPQPAWPAELSRLPCEAGRQARGEMSMALSESSSSCVATTAPPARRCQEKEWWEQEFALRDAWFCVAHSSHVRATPIRRVVHRQPYFLWRERGKIRAAAAHPAQSPASNGSGETAVYPVAERYGVVWVWYGDRAHAHASLIPEIPFLPDEGRLQRHLWGTVLFDCPYELACENSLDSTHAEFLHFGVHGRVESDRDEIGVESSSEAVTVVREATNRRVPPQTKGARLLPKVPFNVCNINHVHLRNGVTIIHSITDPPGASDYVFLAYTPESHARVRATYANLRLGGRQPSRLAKFLAAPITVPATAIFPHIISAQDNLAFSQQYRNYIEKPSPAADCHSRFDAAGMMFRTRMKELIARQRAGDYSYDATGHPGQDISALLRMPAAHVRSSPQQRA